MFIISKSKSTTKNSRNYILGTSLLMAIALLSATSISKSYGSTYNIGTPATDEDIAALDIDVMPDGRGAPAGSGDYQSGKEVYTSRCMACHGADLAGVKGTGAAALIGGRDSLASGSPKKTVESYWPYASTVFDYVKRAMPFYSPGSLSDDETYAVVAYILGEGNILDKDTILSADNIATVEMPNRNGFIADPRPEVFKHD